MLFIWRPQRQETFTVGYDVLRNTSTQFLPAETPVSTHQYLLIYTRSVLAEQTTPVGLPLSDAFAAVSNVTMPDFDLDFNDLGGLLSWSPASDEDLVEDYLVYFGAPAVLINGHWMCASMEDGTNDTSDVNGTGWCPTLYFGRVPVGTENITVPVDTHLADSHFLVYTRSTLVEQTTPVALLIDDVGANVRNISFVGKDLDMHDLGGVLSWEPPETLRRVTSYYVYLAEDAAGSARSQIQPMLMAGDNDIDVPAETPRLNFTHFVVYTASILAEQTTPSFRAIQDEASRAANVSFIDEDLDEFEVGGPLTWLEPEDFSEVTAYNVYLAESRDGENRSLLGNVSVGTNRFDVPADTQLASFTHLVVFAESSLVEQTTPAAVFTESVLAEQSTPVATPLSDSFGLVSNISFPDFDLDETDLGGTLTWAPPLDESQVEQYMIYLAMFTQNASECPDTADSTSFVALVTGSMTLTLAGASPSQLESAMKASLAAFLSVPISWISVSVNPAARRLNRRDRRLSTSWTVQYQVVVPAGSEASVVASANSLGSSNSFEASLAAELVAEGISSSDVAGLTVVSFSTVSVSFVFPESVTPLFSANQTENATSIFEVITTSSTRTTTTSITTTRRSNASEDSHDVTRQMRCPLFLVAFATRSNARSY
ncbi:unnamed protein product [Durusdinium trenchii]|uniref:Uncharacterized protein n=1 Tax=Durusdinium trenchii TaxID=1381693 RepID=A0ABP0SR06_9DINO